MSVEAGVTAPPAPTTTAWVQDWERARYMRFLQLQMSHEFREAIDILNREYPPLEFNYGCGVCGRGFADQRQANEHTCQKGRPPLDLCKRGHDLTVTRRYDSDGRSKGCARCHQDRKNERRAIA